MDAMAVMIWTGPFPSLIDFTLGTDWTEAHVAYAAAADTVAAVVEVSGHFGLQPRADDIVGWSQPEIIRRACMRGSGAIVLPMLGDDAGPVKRWRRRSLVSGLIAGTGVPVIDEYGRSHGRVMR
jgi:hypothetical protein